MAKYDDEVVGSQSSLVNTKDDDEKVSHVPLHVHVDVDELARQHRQTGGALSEQNDRRFVRDVNAKARAEQNAMDDIFDDMYKAKQRQGLTQDALQNENHRNGERFSFLVDDDEVDEICKEGHERIRVVSV